VSYEEKYGSGRRRSGPSVAVTLGGLLGIALAAVVGAEPVVTLTLAQAIALAERKNPSLEAQAQAVESGRAGEVAAGLRPNPTFQNDTTSATAGISQEFEIGGKRRARLESARLATSISRTDLADARRSLILEVRQAFVDALLARSDAALARENLSTFQRVIDLSRLRLEKGALSGGDFLKIEMQKLQLETDLQDADLALATSKATLRRLLGASSLPEDFEIEGNLETGPDPEPLPELQRRALANRPDVRSAEIGIDKADADVRLAKANAYPDPTIGAELLHTGNEVGGPSWFQPFYPKGAGSWGMGLGVSFPIPLFNRNQGEIARAGSERRRAELLARAARDRVLEEVESAAATYRSGLERVRLYRQEYLSRAKESRDIADFAFEKGATSLLDFLDAERTYRATELAFRRELAASAAALARLEAAVGGPATP